MPLPSPTPWQSRTIWAALTGLALLAIVGLVVALVWGLGRVLALLSPVLWPLAIAGVLAYLLDPVVDFFQRKGVPRSRAIIVVFVSAFFLATAVAGSVLPQMIVETGSLVRKIPTYASRVELQVKSWIEHPPEILRSLFRKEPAAPAPETGGATNAPTEHAASPLAAPGSTAEQDFMKQVLGSQSFKSFTAKMAEVLSNAASWALDQLTKLAAVFGLLAGLALVPVYAYYFLLEKTSIEGRWAELLPVSQSRFKDELVFSLKAINDHLITFFRGQVLVAMCDSVLYTIGFLAIGLPYAILIGGMAMVLTMIPFLGAIVTCLAALVIAAVQFGDLLHPALVMVVFAIVQAIEGLVLQPKILGDRVGLHPLAIIIAVMAGTTLLGGVLGGILAIPLAATLRVLLGRYVWKSKTG